MTELTEHDRLILNCVFNPNLPLDEVAYEPPRALEDIEDETESTLQSKKLELKAVNLAETGELEKAINLINQALEIAPFRASLYNNRAHIYQFQKNFEDALTDLSKAIHLATNKNLDKTLCHAHNQRGILYRRLERINEARADFEIAASMGNHFAKNQLVELNPYAALCNQMLKQVMDNLK